MIKGNTRSIDPITLHPAAKGTPNFVPALQLSGSDSPLSRQAGYYTVRPRN